MRRFIATTVAALLLSAGLAASPRPYTPKKPSLASVKSSFNTKSNSLSPSLYGQKQVKTGKSAPARPQIGAASWYGKRFHGRATASGEAYDMFQFTAAHRTLPIGTYAKVTNLRNGKWVVVRVNDRGPYSGNRVMDVSYGAAQMLNFRASGVTKVRIEVVEPETVALADARGSLD